jgi:hypothetical protein
MTASTAELLAGLLDLVDPLRPPHTDGPCSALCVPSCTGSTACGDEDRPTASLVSANRLIHS